MDFQCLFNSLGDWIAFRVDTYVFDIQGNWVGWLPWDSVTVVDTAGSYLGTITDDDRLYRFVDVGYFGYPGYPEYPVYPGYPGYPAYPGYSPLPPMAEDVDL